MLVRPLKKQLLAITSSAALLLAMSALPVSAASPTSSTGVVGTMGAVTAGIVASGTSDVGGSANTGTNVSTDSTASGSVNIGVQGSGSVGTNTGSNSSGMTGTSGDTATVMLSNTDPAVTDYTTGSDSISDAANVQTNAQLGTYAAGIIHSDSNVQDVTLANNEVSMDYDAPGALFGFIPVTIKETATVDQDGTVTVKYPWYHFLVSTDPNVQSELNAQVHTTLSSMAAMPNMATNTTNSANVSASGNANASATTNSGAGFSAQTRAMLMADLYEVLSGHASIATSASGNP